MTEDEVWSWYEKLKKPAPGTDATYDEVAQWRAAKDAGATWKQVQRRFGRNYYDMIRVLKAVQEEEQG